MIAADEEILLGHRVGAHPQPDAGRRLLDYGAQRRVLAAQGDDVGRGKEHVVAVHVEVGDDGLARYRRVGGEVVGAQQALFLGRGADEQQRAAGRLGQAREGAGHFDQRRRAGGVVDGAIIYGAIIYRVAASRLAQPLVVDVSRVDHILVAERGIGARQSSHDVCAAEFGPAAARSQVQLAWQIESPRPPLRGRRQNVVQGSRGAHKQTSGGGSAEHRTAAQLGRRVLGHAVGVEPAHAAAAAEACQGGPGEATLDIGHPDGDEPDGPSLDGGLSLDGVGRVVSPRVRLKARGRPGKSHDDLAAGVDSFIVVVSQLGRGHAVAGEDQRRPHLGLGPGEVG